MPSIFTLRHWKGSAHHAGRQARAAISKILFSMTAFSLERSFSDTTPGRRRIIRTRDRGFPYSFTLAVSISSCRFVCRGWGIGGIGPVRLRLSGDVGPRVTNADPFGSEAPSV